MSPYGIIYIPFSPTNRRSQRVCIKLEYIVAALIFNMILIVNLVKISISRLLSQKRLFLADLRLSEFSKTMVSLTLDRCIIVNRIQLVIVALYNINC